MNGSRTALITLIVSLALLASVPVVVNRAWPAQREDAAAVFDSRGVLPSPSTPPSVVPSSPPRDVETDPTPIDRPIMVAIPRLGITAPVRSVGVDDDNAVRVPRDISSVGWYRLGVAPGSMRGTAVIVGHRDGADGSDGAFVALGRLTAGDRIEVQTQSGATLRYEVRALQLIPREDFATQAPDLFRRTGAARLALVTCGGFYDASRGGYQANVVVLADPLSVS